MKNRIKREQRRKNKKVGKGRRKDRTGDRRRGKHVVRGEGATRRGDRQHR